MSYDFEQTKADFKEISLVSELMASQNNYGTQYPLYAVEVDKKVYMPYDPNWDLESERIEEINQFDLCDDCDKIYGDDGEGAEQLPDHCSSCDTAAFHWYKLERELDTRPGFFFTEQGCKNHIENNSYHYAKPRVYVVSAWRNYEMQALMRQTVNIADKDVPSHYC